MKALYMFDIKPYNLIVHQKTYMQPPIKFQEAFPQLINTPRATRAERSICRQHTYRLLHIVG